jgi:hypothetical protein
MKPPAFFTHVYSHSCMQVSNLLASLHINPSELPVDMAHVHDAKLHEAWAQGQQGVFEPMQISLSLYYFF